LCRHVSRFVHQSPRNFCEFADQIGCTLTGWLTITWGLTDTEGRIQQRQVNFSELYAKWAKYNRFIPAYVWSIENGPNNGLHSHILIHVPSKLRLTFMKMIKSWLGQRAGISCDEKPAKFKKQHYGEGLKRWNAVKGTVRYMLKAIGGHWGKLLKIRPDPEGAGEVTGKRIGTSRNLGEAARLQHKRTERAVRARDRK